MQQIEGSRRVTRGKANFGEAQEVGGDELMLFDLTGKNEFKNFARGLLVASLKQAASGGAESLRSGSLLRIRAVRGQLRVESSELRRDLQIERD